MVDDNVPNHPKFLEAGPAASWLWLCGVAYCRKHHTCGVIPKAALPTLGVPNPRPLVDRLLAARLWTVSAGGWQVHDYEAMYGDDAQAKAEKEEERAKKRAAGKKGGEAKAANRLAQPLAPATPVLVAESKQSPLALSSPLHSSPGASGERGAPRAGAPLHDRSHRNHAQCGRICLHASLFGEFVRRRGHAEADREVRDWALAVERDWADGGPRFGDEPGDPFDFWRARYDEAWPPAASTNGRRPAGGYVPRAAAGRWFCPHVDSCCGGNVTACTVALMGDPDGSGKWPLRPGVAFDLDADGMPVEPATAGAR